MCSGWHTSDDHPGCSWNDRDPFAQDADLTVYWPAVRPCWESS
jgi:hypothetical protein